MKNNKFTKIDSIKDYLDFIGSDKEYKAEMQSCEVCGSNNYSIVVIPMQEIMY